MCHGRLTEGFGFVTVCRGDRQRRPVPPSKDKGEDRGAAACQCTGGLQNDA
jgi:hypothetical protein